LSVQGFLTDSIGVVPDGNYSLLFKLYENNISVWEENHPSVAVENGVFNVLLGGTTPLDTMAFNAPFDLGITVGGDAEISPRTPLAAAAYAKALPGLYTFYRDDGGGGFWEFSPGNPVPNRVDQHFGTVGGGLDNTASNWAATVGGGFDNTASGFTATIAGGFTNTASGDSSTVAGGAHNLASGMVSTVGGGRSNTANGSNSTVGGGPVKHGK